MHIYLKERIWCNINARRGGNNLCVPKVETSWGALCHAWFRVGNVYVGSKIMEALPYRVKLHTQEWSPKLIVHFHANVFEC